MLPASAPSEATNVILRVAQTLTVNMTVEVGAVNEQVTVTATTPLLETGTAEIGRYISVEEFKSWPIIVDDGQRQIQNFIFSSLPGTTGDTFQGTINGGQQYSHEILIEGIPVGRSDLSGGNNNEFSPSAEAIGEFKLQTGAISAQYNGGQTAVANFNIKSGTNDLHGSAFLYIQNEALNALGSPDEDQSVAASQSIAKITGATRSVGPVYIPKVYHGRNKTFWFTNFEKTHRTTLALNGFATLPTTDYKQGDFSSLFDPSFTGNPLSGTQVGTDALGRPSFSANSTIRYRPERGLTGSIIRDPFPGNIIPVDRWDPVAKNIIQNIGIVDPETNNMIRNITKIRSPVLRPAHLRGQDRSQLLGQAPSVGLLQPKLPEPKQ